MKKLFALLLCLTFILSLTPVAAADGMPEETAPGEFDVEASDWGSDESFEEDPADFGEEPPADPWEEAGEGTDAPVEEPAFDGQEGGDAGGDGFQPEMNDGPEYGVQPADEMSEPVEEEELLQQEDEEAEAPQSVLVIFSCDPPKTIVTVYDSQPGPDGTWNAIGVAFGGMMYLFPGEYAYDASCDGCYPQNKIGFTVPEPGPGGSGVQSEFTVTVSLYPMEENSSVDGEEALPLRSTPPDPLVVLPVEPGADLRTPTVFLQEDSRWAAGLYGYLNGNSPSTIGVSGCGILALTNAVYYLNGNFIDPVFAAEFAEDAGFHVEGGTKWDFYRGFAETWGKTCGIQYAGEVKTYSEVKDMLRRDCAAICSVPGHFMALVDYDEELGRFLLLDSSPENIRATGGGYAWLSEQELCAMPSLLYDYDGLVPRFVLLRAAGVLDVSGVLDGVESASLDGFGTFDVWVDGDRVADDQEDYCAVLPRGANYRIDDIRVSSGHCFYGIQAGAPEGTIRSDRAAEIMLGFGTRDYVTEPEPESCPGPLWENRLPAVCVRWAGGIIGPALSLRLP